VWEVVPRQSREEMVRQLVLHSTKPEFGDRVWAHNVDRTNKLRFDVRLWLQVCGRTRTCEMAFD
jgi:hypothetical protein